MCTILLSWNTRPDYNLIMVANRDEFLQRNTRTAQWWEDHPEVLAGKDLQAGGTWLGINRNGKIAAITNYRKFPLEKYETSRGDLVKKYLTQNISARDFNSFLQEKGGEYDGFNLLFGNPDEMFYFSNRGPEKKLVADIYGLSNHLLDTPWPKVERGKNEFRNKLSPENFNPESLFDIMTDTRTAEDHLLPDTGIGIEKERLLSSIFIQSPDYGTRISTYVSMDKSGNVVFHEKSFLPSNETRVEFKIG